MNYREQYKDPRWQKKRLEVLDGDGFACRNCGDSTSPLHVHHIFYISGRSVWEYDERSLMTLCEDCHKSAHEKQDLQRTIDSIKSIKKNSPMAAPVWARIIGTISKYCDSDEEIESVMLQIISLVISLRKSKTGGES